jgi:hypothetical protein
MNDVMDMLMGDAPVTTVPPRFSRWFGNPRELGRISWVFSKFYWIWETVMLPNFTKLYVDERDNETLDGEPLAYADSVGSPWKIRLWDPWYEKLTQRTPSSRAGVLIHELYHGADAGSWDPGERGLRLLGTPKTHTEPADYNLWLGWVANAGPLGGDGKAFDDRFGKARDANCYKYFAERL